MNIHQQRIYILSRIFTLSLSVFLVNFILTRFYLRVWHSLERSVPDLPSYLSILLWVLLPLLLSVSTPLVVIVLDRKFFRISHPERRKFYLLSWIIFAGLIGLSFFDYIYLDILLPLLTALSAIFVFRLYQMNRTGEKEQRR